MAQVCESHRPGGGCDFALVTGDLIYNTGVRGVNDPKFSSHFEVPFEKLRQLPMWSVPGNHDWYRPGSVQAEINYTTAKTGWRMPFNHFAVPGLPEWLHIYGLDTAIADDLNRGNSEQKAVLSELVELQRQAVRETLCAKPGWRFLFGHHPIYSSGQHGRDDGPDGVAPGIREALEGIIQDCKVQAYFAGHDHLQEHLVAEPGPFHQIIQGAASEVRKSDRPFTLPGTLPKVERTFLARKFGFALVTVSRQAAEVEFYGFEDEKGPLDNERKAMYRFAMSQ